MEVYKYKDFFPGQRWEDFVKDFIGKLKNESATLTCLPGGGRRFHLKLIQENYHVVNKDDPTKIIFVEIIKDNASKEEISNLILRTIRNNLSLPSKTKNMNCEELFDFILNSGNRILLILNRIERLQGDSEVLSFLEYLRTIDPFNVRFLIGCDIGCIFDPSLYKDAGAMMLSNVVPLSMFTKDETSKLIKLYDKIYGWNVEEKFFDRIFELSGGIPTLIKYLSKFTHDNKPKVLDESLLLSDPALSFRFQIMLDELKKYRVIKGKELDNSKFKELKELSLIDKNGVVQSELFRLFIAFQDYEKFELQKLLSNEELKLFKLVQKSSPVLVTLEEVAKEIWGKSANAKFSMWAIYKIISNVNKRIKGIGYKIKNYRGRGYTLVEIK